MTWCNQSVTGLITGYGFTRNINHTYGWTNSWLTDYRTATVKRPDQPLLHSLSYRSLRPHIPNNYYKHLFTCPSLPPNRLSFFSLFRPIMLAHIERRIRISMSNDWVIWQIQAVKIALFIRNDVAMTTRLPGLNPWVNSRDHW